MMVVILMVRMLRLKKRMMTRIKTRSKGRRSSNHDKEQ